MTARDHRHEFSARLRRLMEARGLSPKSLLWMMGDATDSTTKVLYWMNGSRLPSCESLYLLKDALHCTWDELMGD